MRFQPGVLGPAIPQIWWAMGMADMLHREMFGKQVEITSIKDHKHRLGSKHKQDKPPEVEAEAFDIRTRHLSEEQRKAYHKALRGELDPHGFDTIDEADHLHVEYDPKPGEVFIGNAAE